MNLKSFKNSQSMGSISQSILTIEEVYRNNNAINDLNTYRNWGLFHLQDEPVYEGKKVVNSKTITDENGKQQTVKGTFVGDDTDSTQFFTNYDGNQYWGTKSLFNNVNAVGLGYGANGSGWRIANNMPLLDTQSMRKKMRERGGCTIKELCDDSAAGLMGRAIYNYSDFMYCKHLGKISNNYLITLRRFPFPCGDHINFTEWGLRTIQKGGKPNEKLPGEYFINKHMPDQGRLVTWMGTPGNDLNEILKYSVLMPYEEMQAEVQDVQGGAEETGFLGSLFNMANPSYTANALRGVGGTSAINQINNMIGSPNLPKWMGGGNALAAPRNDDWAYYRDQTKPYGPVDAISKTHIRKSAEKGGLDFEQEINLCFDYELRSYDGINGKAAMLDLLSNILAVTYTNGVFWGGAIHTTGASQSKAFTNLPIFHMHAPVSFNGLVDASLNSVRAMGTAMNGNKPVKNVSDVANMIKNMISNIGNLLVGGALNALGRPQKQAVHSLLNNNPVGLWHLTIGNPKHPIMMMGNMILTKVEIQHYGPLGLDDFPTGLRVNVTLKHGMPRDRMQIEQMYTMGDYRLYIPQGKNIELMYENSESLKSNVTFASRTVTHGDGTTEVIDGVDELTQKKEYERDKSGNQTEMVDESQTSVTLEEPVSQRYLKYFGTLDKCAIGKNSREGHMGSSPAKTAAAAKADLAVVQNEQNNNKNQ